MGATRSFELVAGSSAKFWEINRDGSTVTVRYGRLGAAGQTRATTFDTDVAATAHADKLIAEKTKKGYAEVGASAGTPVTATAPAAAPAGPTAPGPTAPEPASEPAPPVDEDTLLLPPTWHQHRMPRRGDPDLAGRAPSPSASASAPAPAEADALVKKHRADIEQMLQRAVSDAALAAAGRAYLAGEPPTPSGAAVVAEAAATAGGRRGPGTRPFVEAWLAAHDLTFAAVATVELLTTRCKHDYGVDGKPFRFIERTHSPHGEYRLRMGRLVDAGLVRVAIAGADDATYSRVVEALLPVRETGPVERAVTSFLVPTRLDWVGADCAEAATGRRADLAYLLMLAASTPEHARAVGRDLFNVTSGDVITSLVTIVDGLGVGALDVLAFQLDNRDLDTDTRRQVLSAVAALPSDDALRWLVGHINGRGVRPLLIEAVQRFPDRAVRILAEVADVGAVTAMFHAHVKADPETARRLLSTLDEPAAGRVRAALDAAATVIAPLDALPQTLVSPRWTIRRPARRPVAVEPSPALPMVRWAPGERNAWLAARAAIERDYRGFIGDWAAIAGSVTSGRLGSRQVEAFFVFGPDELARPLIGQWRQRYGYNPGEWLRVVAARFELDALPMLVDAARSEPARAFDVLMPFASAEIATFVADVGIPQKTLRPSAVAWLCRHPVDAARALLPAALGTSGAAQRQAEAALRVLVKAARRDDVLAAADGYGPPARAAVEQLIGRDDLDMLPAKIPAPAQWIHPAALAPVQLRDGSGAVPITAVGHLLTMLAFSPMAEPYAGIAEVKQACTERSLAEFAWSLFEQWQSAGTPSKDGWVLDAVGLLGDDDTVRRLTPVIRAWPGNRGHAKAVTGLDVLAAIGTDVALMHLHSIAQRVQFKGLKEKAAEKIAEVAAALGLRPEELADRLVPTFNLDAPDGLTLDYGRCQFRIGFDEQLKPYVVDGDGKRRKDLPKPGNTDDDLASEAYRRFAALKKDVRTVASDQIRRLEQAMVGHRRWTGTEFATLLVAHPLLGHIVRRVVWATFDADGTVTGSLRVAEDRTYADAGDKPVTLADGTAIGVAHPLHLADTLPAWAEVFADYEILQPFPQLRRESYALTDDERAAGQLARFNGMRADGGKVLGLQRRGWRRGTPQDAGWQGWIEREVPGGRYMVVDLDPGFGIGMHDGIEDQTIEQVSLTTDPSRWGSRKDLPIGEADSVTLSEVIRDLTEVCD